MDPKRLPSHVRPLEGGGLTNIASEIRQQPAPWRNPRRRAAVSAIAVVLWAAIIAFLAWVLAHAG